MDPFYWLALPLVTAAVMTGVAARASSRDSVVVLGGLALGFVIIAGVASAGWAWLLRDGLGPGIETSTGARSLAVFWDGFWPTLLAAASAAIGIVRTCRRRVRVLSLADNLDRNSQSF